MIPTSAASLLTDRGEVVSTDGDSIGKVGQVYVDNETGSLSWVTVKTGWFGSNESFVPLDEATLQGDTVTVPYTKAKVKDAPHHAVDAELSVEEEEDLYRYYGIGRSGGSADSSYETDSAYETYETPAVAQTPATDTAPASKSPAADGYLTRSEEQLRVGTKKVEAGRARLKKFVVTEQQTVTVPVTREEVKVVREPLAPGDSLDGATIGEDSIEVALHRDEVVVDKEIVGIEKVRLDTETVTEQQQVTEAVRKEQIETETDGIATTGNRTGTSADTDPSLADKAKGLADKAKNAIK